MRLPRFVFLFLAVALCASGFAVLPRASDAASKVSHGISIFGDLKYGPDFKHFSYVNPNAPKGGRLRLAGRDSFDNLNPFILKGDSAQGVGLLFDSLMTRATDEPDALYGLVAESIELFGIDRKHSEASVDQSVDHGSVRTLDSNSKLAWIRVML